MNEKQRMRWEKQRAKGKKKFIWMNGVLESIVHRKWRNL